MHDRRINGTARRVHAPTRITVIPIPPVEEPQDDLAEAGLRLARMRRTLERRRRHETAAVGIALIAGSGLLIGGTAYLLIRWPAATLAAALVFYALISVHLRLRQ